MQAQATVRVISGVVVDLTGQRTAQRSGDVPPVRETSARIEGAPERLRLAEFQ